MSEEILKMKPGNSLNILVTEKVFGYKHFFGDEVPIEHHCRSADGREQEVWLTDKSRYCKWCGDMPMFSEDISAAWEVVEKMNGEFAFEVGRAGERYGRKWTSRFGMLNEWVEADTAPEAICKAALLAVDD